MKLYNFFRSGASHRLRIALNLKGLTYEYVPVDLRTEQHLGTDYKALNPQGLVPALVDAGRVARTATTSGRQAAALAVNRTAQRCTSC